MSGITLTAALRAEYQSLFDTCTIDQERFAEIDRVARAIETNKARYVALGDSTIPWYFIGIMHNLECGLSFNKHLHNGDPLTARTVRVPKGYPKTGTPPFTFDQSARDALQLKKLYNWTDWTIPGQLYKLESFNGFGYRLYKPYVKSPYLWSFSNHYTKGKYIADSTWSDTAVSQQTGAAVVLRRLAERQAISFDPTGVPIVDTNPQPVPAAITTMSPLVKYRPNVVDEHAKTLQRSLNQFPGIFLTEDGKAGKRTSDALKAVVGNYLVGDPRS